MTLVSKLERIIGEERTQKLVNNRVYKFSVDALAMNLFSLSYALNEKFIAGMDWTETGKTRLAAAIGNTITGRPYGIYRDFMMKIVQSTESLQLIHYQDCLLVELHIQQCYISQGHL